jgi:peptidoglycan-N-acetylglucosamine deacetylase
MFLLSMAVSSSGALSQTTRPAVPVTPEEVVRGDSSRPWVSLVFNAGAGYQPGEAILDTLREKDVRTTFFLMGWWAERRPEIVARIAGEGHEVASHGHEVFDLTSVSSAEVVADLERADAVISAITGQSTRPLWSPSAGYRDARVRELAASIGYRPIYWTLDSGDWTTDASPDAVRARVLNNAANGSIIVMHFDSPRTAAAIAPALPSIIDGLRGQGLRLVTVSELITGELWSTPDL